MTDTPMTDEETLKKAGIRITALRLMIWRLMRHEINHIFSLADLEEAIPTVDKSTLFRTLTLFSDSHLLHNIDDGSGTDRTILSGIAEHYEPEDLRGKDVLFIANLAPRKIMGIESQGMILSAENFDGALSVTTLTREVKPGSQVK